MEVNSFFGLEGIAALTGSTGSTGSTAGSFRSGLASPGHLGGFLIDTLFPLFPKSTESFTPVFLPTASPLAKSESKVLGSFLGSSFPERAALSSSPATTLSSLVAVVLRSPIKSVSLGGSSDPDPHLSEKKTEGSTCSSASSDCSVSIGDNRYSGRLIINHLHFNQFRPWLRFLFLIINPR